MKNKSQTFRSQDLFTPLVVSQVFSKLSSPNSLSYLSQRRWGKISSPRSQRWKKSIKSLILWIHQSFFTPWNLKLSSKENFESTLSHKITKLQNELHKDELFQKKNLQKLLRKKPWKSLTFLFCSLLILSSFIPPIFNIKLCQT